MYKAINRCRVCGNNNLVMVLDLGIQALTGIFPKTAEQPVTEGPLQLVKCVGAGDDSCGLLQLAHSYEPSQMYGESYGYRSGLNPSMVSHLHGKVAKILSLRPVTAESIVLDIGSNDGTTLSAYPEGSCIRVGMDPTAEKFRHYYPADVVVIPDFFSAHRFNQAFPGKKAQIVTSFSMFYDLESPMDFVREIASILDDHGIWVFEQSYMPLMLKNTSYDTVCHEHLEYYGLKQILWMFERCGLKVVDLELNNINGGSFSVVAAKRSSHFQSTLTVKEWVDRELAEGLDGLEPFISFAQRVHESRVQFRAFVHQAKAKGLRVVALGASTKGNVILQYCGFSQGEIEVIGEVNEEKFGAFTPGTLIPIVDETLLLASDPDVVVVLPWHFKDFFLKKYAHLEDRMFFPLPY